MPKYAFVLVAALVFGLIGLACNGDDNSSTPTVGQTPTAASEPTATEPATPGSQKTPPPEESPGAQTPIPRITFVPTLTPGAEGTPAVAPADLSQYEGETIDDEQCSFDPAAGTASCPGRGTYALTPPLIGEDVSCSVLIVQAEPVAVRCTSQEPLQTVYYEIKG